MRANNFDGTTALRKAPPWLISQVMCLGGGNHYVNHSSLEMTQFSLTLCLIGHKLDLRGKSGTSAVLPQQTPAGRVPALTQTGKRGRSCSGKRLWDQKVKLCLLSSHFSPRAGSRHPSLPTSSNRSQLRFRPKCLYPQRNPGFRRVSQSHCSDEKRAL